MALSLHSRRVGDITVVKCSGRITEGEESAALKEHLKEVLLYRPHIVLDVSDVQFIDSSGLGLLTRLLTKVQAAHGGLRLCAVPAHIAEILRVTRLKTIFESHATEGDAIAAFYQPTKAAGALYRFDADILCVEASENVLAYLRQLLGQAGYGVIIADNLPDALTLLKATRPKLVVIGAALRSSSGTQTADTFRTLADAAAVLELPADFSTHDAGEAGRQLLDRVRALIAPATAP